MAIYVDDGFAGTGWGRWNGGGHLTADSLPELHDFAQRLGLQRSWFQDAARPEMAHYDLTAGKRTEAIAAGATSETWRDAAKRVLVSSESPSGEGAA